MAWKNSKKRRKGVGTSSKRTRRKPINLGQVYARVAKKAKPRLTLESAEDIQHLYAAFVKASFCKCLEFNLAVTAKDVRNDDAFFYVSGLRSICEDLIVLRFLSRVDEAKRSAYLKALLARNLAEGISVQHKFFKANNPLQPVIGAPFPIGIQDRKPQEDEIELRLQEAREDVKAAAKAFGFGNAPRVSEMARVVGLTSTYDFIYFLTSNYVHFNPASFLKMGWTNQKDKNFSFSVSHMSGYYGSTAIFYGAILLIGFANFLASRSELDWPNLEAEMKKLEEFVGSLHRWPEIVTFEEMNLRPPLFWLLHAMREVMREEGQVQYGQILAELKAGVVPSDNKEM